MNPMLYPAVLNTEAKYRRERIAADYRRASRRNLPARGLFRRNRNRNRGRDAYDLAA